MWDYCKPFEVVTLKSLKKPTKITLDHKSKKVIYWLFYSKNISVQTNITPQFVLLAPALWTPNHKSYSNKCSKVEKIIEVTKPQNFSKGFFSKWPSPTKYKKIKTKSITKTIYLFKSDLNTNFVRLKVPN